MYLEILTLINYTVVINVDMAVFMTLDIHIWIFIISNFQNFNLNMLIKLIYFHFYIQLKPPQQLDETIKVKGIEQTEQYSVLILACVKDRNNERYTIDRQILCNLFNGGAPVTIRQILNYLPFRANVHISGQAISTMDSVRVSTRVLARLGNRGPAGGLVLSARGDSASGRSSSAPTVRGMGHSTSSSQSSSVRETDGGRLGRSGSSVPPTPFATRRNHPIQPGQQARPSPRKSPGKSQSPVGRRTPSASLGVPNQVLRSNVSGCAVGQVVRSANSSAGSANQDFADSRSHPNILETSKNPEDTENYELGRLFKEQQDEKDLTLEEEEKLLSKSEGLPESDTE